jgi:hypothetical protein
MGSKWIRIYNTDENSTFSGAATPKLDQQSAWVLVRIDLAPWIQIHIETNFGRQTKKTEERRQKSKNKLDKSG